MPSIQASRPWPLMNLRAARGPEPRQPFGHGRQRQGPSEPAERGLSGEKSAVTGPSGAAQGGLGRLGSDGEHVKPESVHTELVQGRAWGSRAKPGFNPTSAL